LAHKALKLREELNFLMPISAAYVEPLPAQILSDDFQLELLENEYELINVGRMD
jgi:hypothetical protein